MSGDEEMAARLAQVRQERAALQLERRKRYDQAERLAELCARLNIARIAVDGIELEMAPHAFQVAQPDAEPQGAAGLSDDEAEWAATGMQPVRIRDLVNQKKG